MAVISVRIAFLLVCLMASDILADEIEGRVAPINAQKISQTCFGCICEAASGCDTNASCEGDVCGPFRITYAYWADGNKPTINNEPNTAPGAWIRCVKDPFCAAQAIQGYMNRYAQDCNGDGIINCDDYVRIHRFGGYGCANPLDSKYENVYKSCMQVFDRPNQL